MAKSKKLSFDQLPGDVQSALLGSDHAIDQETLLRELLESFGGPKEIAKTMYMEFHDAPPGGITRQRIMELFVRLIMSSDDKNGSRVKHPVDMTKEELLNTTTALFKVTMDGTLPQGLTEALDS